MKYIYSFFIASPSLIPLLNGLLPIWLLINLSYFSYNFINAKVIIPLWLYLIPISSLLSFFYSSQYSKIGHLIAYFIIFLIAVPSFVVYFLNDNRKKTTPIKKIYDLVLWVCFTLFFTSLIDFILLYNGITFESFLPYVGNKDPVMVSIFSRSRGFWAEPTDLSLAANAFFPLLIGFNSYKNIGKSKFIKAIIIYSCWVTIHLLAKSGSGTISIFISFTLVNISFLFIKNRWLIIKKTNLYFLLTLTVVLLGIVFMNFKLFSTYIEQILPKLTFNTESISVSTRLDSWTFALSNYFSKDFFILLLGSGPGHHSVISDLEIGKHTLNWIISILSELGFIGFLGFLILCYKVFKLSLFMPYEIKKSYYISFLSLLIHYFTMSGFYLPPLPFLISLPIVFQRFSSRD
ncbi:MAG: hypothetical protein JJ834_002590 [Prochlorococcus marinus XMU1425]|nr:hypothetical protein [Prochlorococcus marinus XMU1425]MCR8534154.1 hypothetical protein [Prochlorococcus marinus XMU1426]